MPWPAAVSSGRVRRPARRRPTALPAAAAAACAVAAALTLSGCSLGSDERPRANEATIAYSTQPDSLDPALAYSVEAAALLWNVYTPPLTYRHVDGIRGTDVVPGLARALPALSRGGRRYRLQLRPRLRYSDGRRVRASDIERAIKRTLYLASPGSHLFSGIRGARRFTRVHDPSADIAGIRTEDRTGRIAFDLEDPLGTFRYALATPFAAPVPPGTPFKRLSHALPPATGAFRFAEIDSGHELVLERNNELADLPNVPAANLARLTVKFVDDRRLQANRIIDGKLDYMFDPLPVDSLVRIRREYPERYREFTTNSTLYFWLNSSVPPFNDRRLRRAVHLGLDKTALARLYGGLLAPTCNFLPPGIAGYRRLKPCPFGAPGSGGNVQAARRALARAGALGTPVTVWGHTLEPNRDATEAFADQLREMGFKPELKFVSSRVYFQLVGGNRPIFQAGIGAWFPEFPHPASFFAAVRGDLADAGVNYNYSRTDLPGLTAAIKRLEGEPRLDARVRARWAALDRRIVEDAGVIPYGHSRASVFMSARMNVAQCAARHLVYVSDFSRFCLR